MSASLGGELPEALTSRVAFALQLALSRAQAMGEEALQHLGLTGRQYGLLALLEPAASAPARAGGHQAVGRSAAAGETTPSDGKQFAQHRLGAALGMDRTTTASMARELAARGLIVRTTDPHDRRRMALTLTTDGEELRTRAAQVLADCDQRFTAPLSIYELTELTKLLGRLTD